VTLILQVLMFYITLIFSSAFSLHYMQSLHDLGVPVFNCRTGDKKSLTKVRNWLVLSNFYAALLEPELHFDIALRALQERCVLAYFIHNFGLLMFQLGLLFLKIVGEIKC
jgi:hypothetical protein